MNDCKMDLIISLFILWTSKFNYIDQKALVPYAAFINVLIHEIFIWQNSIIESLFIGTENFQLKTCKRWIIHSNEWMMNDERFEIYCPIVWSANEKHIAYYNFGFNENLLNSSRQTNTTQIVIHLSFSYEDYNVGEKRYGERRKHFA